MHRPLLRRGLLTLALQTATSALLVSASAAQSPETNEKPAEPEDAEASEPAPEEQEEAEPAPAEPAPAPAAPPEATQESPRVLEPPQLAPLELEPGVAGPSVGEGPTVDKAAAPVPEKKGWTAPETIFHLHGYMRMRGTLLRDGHLGHTSAADRLQLGSGYLPSYSGNTPGVPTQTTDYVVRHNYDPFTYFRSQDSVSPNAEGSVPAVEGGCGDDYNPNGSACGKRNQVGGDLRLRLKPEIHVSDDVRVKAWIDVLDNVGLGTVGYGPSNGYQPDNLDLGNSLRVRRAWGEARNRDIGELRFGRMGADWGLGILDNGGDRKGIDSDFSSDVDRIMGITNLAGFYFMAAYDWASQGRVMPGSATPSGVPLDRAQRDDLSTVTAAIAHRLEDEVQTSKLLRGEAVVNYGLYFVYRRQQLKQRSEGYVYNTTGDTAYDGATGTWSQSPYYRLDQTQYIPDLWFQLLWEGLRIELEAAFVAGKMGGGCPILDTTPGSARSATPAAYAERYDVAQGRSSDGTCKFRQLGIALEAEYRLFDDRLGIHFLSGLASGDSQAYGLAQTNDPSLQTSDGKGGQRITTYQFHPDYRVDLILWRTLMRRVAGAYYFKPGVSYDFIHDPYGQKAGARVDVIYSRATRPEQAWGNNGNLGLELDLSLYYQSEDGPDPLDGFYTTIQWGILFPFKGLGYSNDIAGAPDLAKNAMVLRGVAGIAF